MNHTGGPRVKSPRRECFADDRVIGGAGVLKLLEPPGFAFQTSQITCVLLLPSFRRRRTIEAISGLI